jgi:hypothetical protein
MNAPSVLGQAGDRPQAPHHLLRSLAVQQNLPLRNLQPDVFLEELKAPDVRCRELWARHPWVD